jgi:phage tail sheath protein FI
VKFPWFAPAGFDRGSLNFVLQTSIRVNQADRNALFDANINPIVKFPGANYVFFSQNTLQQAVSALESINVKRMVLELKRQMVIIGNRILFEQNTPALRTRFVNEASLVLAAVQIQQGIEKFAVICNSSNNTAEDVNNNRMNAQIRVLPTRAIEYVVMDFVILPSGVQL